MTDNHVEMLRLGCCAGWPKPCSYHEGYRDAYEKCEDELVRLRVVEKGSEDFLQHVQDALDDVRGVRPLDDPMAMHRLFDQIEEAVGVKGNRPGGSA